jgi:hypothetical protein
LINWTTERYLRFLVVFFVAAFLTAVFFLAFAAMRITPLSPAKSIGQEHLYNSSFCLRCQAKILASKVDV